MLKQKFILLFIFLIIFSFVKTVDAYYVRYNENITNSSSNNIEGNITQLQEEDILGDLNKNPYFKYVVFGVVALIIVTILDKL